MTEEQMNILHKEIGLIEGAIERMARNSFLIKGWTLSLIALVVTMTKCSLVIANLTVFIAVIGFWWLDSYYLHLERAFRKLYEDRISKRAKGDWTGDLYVLNCGKYLSLVQRPVRVMFTSSTFPFYAGILLLLIIVLIAQVNWADLFAKLPHFCHCQHP